MQSLLDPSGSYLRTEKKVKKFLRSIDNDKIKIFYENIELTPFPILIAREYLKRFSKKPTSTVKKKRFGSRTKTRKRLAGAKKSKATKTKKKKPKQ